MILAGLGYLFVFGDLGGLLTDGNFGRAAAPASKAQVVTDDRSLGSQLRALIAVLPTAFVLFAIPVILAAFVSLILSFCAVSASGPLAASPRHPRVSTGLDVPLSRLFGSSRHMTRYSTLRLPSVVQTKHLNLEAIVEKTIMHGGLFTPEFERRRISPEYVILIDRVRGSDQLAQMFREYVEGITSLGIDCEIYYFQQDPRECFDVHGRKRSLAALARRQFERRLVIVSDGAGLLDPATGMPGPWTEDVRAWRRRAMVSPRHPSIWSERERVLIEQVPLPVIPAIGNWIEMLGAQFASEQEYNGLGAGPSGQFGLTNELFSFLSDRSFRWIDQRSPDRETVDRLLSVLGSGLGKSLFAWLSACAVFPRLSWNITIHLGQQIVDEAGRPLFSEDRLLILCQLPWFRRGSMPVWLRQRLIAAMPDSQYQEVRGLFENNIVLSGKPNVSELATRVAIVSDISDSDPESEIADVVLLNFVQRRRGKGTDLYTDAKVFAGISSGRTVRSKIVAECLASSQNLVERA